MRKSNGPRPPGRENPDTEDSRVGDRPSRPRGVGPAPHFKKDEEPPLLLTRIKALLAQHQQTNQPRERGMSGAGGGASRLSGGETGIDC